MDYESAFDLAMSEAAHSAPETGTLAVPGAHRAMRRHRSCARTQCELKAAALQVLKDAGRIQHADDYDKAK
jgi:hypothetical protein